jgi:SAM-dependent methyltransferase
MNPEHEDLCASPKWADYVQTEILPTVTAGIELGQDMLEIGPGPGAATGWLAERVAKLTALESDEGAAARLAERYDGRNVTVDTGDATRMPYPAGAFDAVVSFTMLHHVPTVAAVLRVLRPGGTLAGSDSLASVGLHHFHADDVYNPLDPATLLCWLRTLGFCPVTITVGEVLMFTARKPAAQQGGDGCTT